MSEARGVRILLVGCGELGSRHLQAVASLPQVQEIDVVDPRPQTQALGRARLAELAEPIPSPRVRWCTSLEQARDGGALCIVSTQAQGRCQLIRDIAEGLHYSTFLVEKIVGQSIREIEELYAFVEAHGLSVWVNLKTRAYPTHLRIKQQVGIGEPIVFHSMGGNHGLANNGVHTADLFAFYDGAREIKLAGAAVDPVLHRSKRGDNVFDLSGTLQGVTAQGSHFTLSYARDHAQSEVIAVATKRYRCLVDHMGRWVVESDESTGWTWRQVPFEENILVSHMTKGFVTDLLGSSRCLLPTLEESLIAHRFILGALQPTFSQLLERTVELCPVT